jgi:hypothetical protein
MAQRLWRENLATVATSFRFEPSLKEYYAEEVELEMGQNTVYRYGG